MTLEERVARAIIEVESSVFSGETPAEHYRNCARAAIAAMREPTPAVISALKPFAYSAWGDASMIAEEMWRAATDAALGIPGVTK